MRTDSSVDRRTIGAEPEVRQRVVRAEAHDAQRVVARLRARGALRRDRDVGVERVEQQVDVQRLLPRADHRIAQRRAEHRGGAVIALLPQAAGRNRGAVAAIDPPLQAGGADEHLGGGLAEILRCWGRRDSRRPRSSRRTREKLLKSSRPRNSIGPVWLKARLSTVARPEIFWRLTWAIRLSAPGVIGGRLQHGAQADARHVLRQQQVALQRDRIDRLLLGEPVEEAQHLGAGRADVAVQLDAGDAALGDDEAQPAVVVEIGRDRGEHVAVGAVALQDRLARGIDLRQRHRGPDQAGGKLRDLRLGIGGDALDLDAGDPHRLVGHLAAGRRWRRDDRAGRRPKAVRAAGRAGSANPAARDLSGLRHRLRLGCLREGDAPMVSMAATYRVARAASLVAWPVCGSPPPWFTSCLLSPARSRGSPRHAAS